MKFSKELIPTGMALFLIIMLIYFYPSMPDPMASHWNAQGEVDGYMSKFWLSVLILGITIGIHLLLWAVPKIDPLKKNIQEFINYYFGFRVFIIGFLLYTCILTIVANLGYLFDMGLFVVPPIAVLFYYCGILMKHAKRNWFIGIRTPYTLSSDAVWKKTHDLGSKWFKIYAVVIFMALVFKEYAAWIIAFPIIVIAVGLFVYSYLEYQKEKKS